jgi:hypothetical protein
MNDLIEGVELSWIGQRLGEMCLGNAMYEGVVGGVDAQKAACEYYLKGVFDTIYHDGNTVISDACDGAAVDTRNMREMFLAYIRANPQLRVLPSAEGAQQAFYANYPCLNNKRR